MKIIQTKIPDVLILEPKVFDDSRGFFLESFNQRVFFNALGRTVNFVQDNHSRSAYGVVRGLHYQIQQPQAKLVRVVRGSVYDVVVDLRKASPTFGQWLGVELNEQNQRQVWVPEGFAHGFMVTSEIADFVYKTTDFYAPRHERCIRWDDPELAIVWPNLEQEPLLSSKDALGASFAEAELFN